MIKYIRDSVNEEPQISSFEAKKVLETKEARLNEARKFIASLSQKPYRWKLSGSSARGDFRPTSDVDIIALYEKEADVPLKELSVRTDIDNELIDGFIDFHYFPGDWAVYKADPEAWRELEASVPTEN